LIKKALISVSNKEGILSFAQELTRLGIDLISTGGTYRLLRQHHIPVTAVEEVTEFPEMLDGRVKTLHPNIFGGILAQRKNPSHLSTCAAHAISLIDLVVVNLYPFEKTISKADVSLEEAIENIDIGGPSLIRAAAKNFESVGVVVNPSRYPQILEELKHQKKSLSHELRSECAWEAFYHTSRYDALIASFFEKRVLDKKGFPAVVVPLLEKVSDLRYGENPHQKAAFYRMNNGSGFPNFIQHHGKELSFNNLLDLEAAWQIVKSFDMPSAVIIKHTNPCGTAIGNSLAEAYQKAYQADSVSAFGSIVGLNRNVDEETAKQISQTFVEAVIAPGYDEKALKSLSEKASIRILSLESFFNEPYPYTFRYVDSGFLIQTPDAKTVSNEALTCVTQRKPTVKEMNDMLFAFIVVKFIKSNAILIVKDGQTVGIGAGQMSRVDAMTIALKKAGDKAKRAVVASDAFFPFRDSLDLAAESQIAAVIQPGGSKRDHESIACCDENQMAMVFTGSRHFKH